MENRKITLYSTKGGKKYLDTSIATWGELKILVEELGYDLSNLVATENTNKTNLESDAAVLPVSDFVLFLRPRKTKAGGNHHEMSFKELRQIMRAYPELATVVSEFAEQPWETLDKKQLADTLDTVDHPVSISTPDTTPDITPVAVAESLTSNDDYNYENDYEDDDEDDDEDDYEEDDYENDEEDDAHSHALQNAINQANDLLYSITNSSVDQNTLEMLVPALILLESTVTSNNGRAVAKTTIKSAEDQALEDEMNNL